MTVRLRDSRPEETFQPIVDLNVVQPASHEQASVVLTRKQRMIGIALIVLLMSAFVVAPERTAKTAMLLIAILYLGSSCCRLFLSLLGARTTSDRPTRSLPDCDLPIYTVLVPVYRESALIPALIASLSRLEYPADKLDVLLLLERDDEETLSTFHALDAPDFIRPLIVPDFGPKGKPRACNAGLAHARGAFLVIYDAEDAPEPDQLKKVVATFQSSEPDLACVQCKLDFFNADENLLTRWFTSEYSAWFDLYLPGLDRVHLPIPLGGTSNHFVTSSLRELGGWDPYNVTEDADLGMRLARAGLTTRMIDSTTWEEANSRLGNWIRQRSRWMKGYAVTWLVHMRNPWQLYREVGLGGFLSVQLTLGITIGMALLNPFFWLMTLAWVLTRADPIHMLFSGPTFYIGSASFFVGNWILILTAMIGCYRRRHFKVVKYTLLLPIYWALMSIAAWKGVLQLWRRPSFWEKTDHGLTSHPVMPFAYPGMSPSANKQMLTSFTAAMPRSHGSLSSIELTSVAIPRSSRLEETAIAQTNVASPIFTRMDLGIWIVFGLLATFAGLWAALHQHAFHGDALARTYSALQIVRGNEPKLANIGLIWPILPTLLQAPIAFIAPGLAGHGGIGPIFSGIAFGACIMQLNRILQFYLPSRAMRWLTLILFFANPLILQLTLSGLSEMIFISFLLLAWWGVEVATRDADRELTGIMMASVGAAGAFNCRYEGVIMGLAIMAVLFCLLAVKSWSSGTLRASIPQLEAGVVLFLACFGYAVGLFFFFNFTIMGNPLYFARGTGSIDQWMHNWLQTSQTVTNLVGNPVESLRYAGIVIWFIFAGILVMLPIVAGLIIRTRDLRLLLLLGLTLLTPAQQALVTYQGQSPGWKRYYVVTAFFGFILIAQAVRLICDKYPRVPSRFMTIACVLLFAFSTTMAWRLNDDRSVASDFSEDYLGRALSLSASNDFTVTEEDDSVRIGRELANDVFLNDPNARILADDLKATLIILFTEKPGNFIVPNNHHFEEFVTNPVGNVQYILLPAASEQNTILKQYPDLLTTGEPFLELVATYQEQAGDHDTWLLYRVAAELAVSPTL